MSRATTALWLFVAAACLTGPGLAWRSMHHAERDATLQLTRLATLRATIAELAHLRSITPARPSHSAGKPNNNADQSFAPKLSESLSACGLPSSCLLSLTPSSEPIALNDGGPAITRRREAVTLGQLTLPQFGAFLQSWRQREPSWTVASIDQRFRHCRARHARGRPAAPGSTLARIARVKRMKKNMARPSTSNRPDAQT